MRGISWCGVLIALLVAGSLSSCSVLETGPDDGVRSELDRRQRQWRAHDIQDYAYTVRRICFCPETFTDPVVVQVEEGKVESRTYEDSGEPVEGEHARFWPEVEGLFEIVQDAIDRDAASLLVEYHPRLGYPTSIRIDYDRRVADEELTITTSELHR